jgi:regulatory protein
MQRRPSTRRRVFADEGSAPDLGVDPSSQGEADPATAARNIVLRRLTRAPQTRAQLADALAAKGIADDVAEQVLDRMTDVGLINDAEFAALYVRSRRSSRGLAPRVLAQELRAKGVDAELIDAELGGISHDDDRALAESLVARKLAATAGLDPEARTRRLAGMLIRKGFHPGMSFDIVRSALHDDDLLE